MNGRNTASAMHPIIIIGDMDKIYLDIMVKGRFYKQIPFSVCVISRTIVTDLENINFHKNKVMKAPEKIYFFENPITEAPDDRWLSKRSDKNDIEYVRTDSFMDKAWSWIEDNMLSSNQQDKSHFYYEQFINYMKGE